MLPLFFLRLAFGMLAALLLLSPAQINPRFYRTHFLTALGLGAGALVLLWDGHQPRAFFATAALALGPDLAGRQQAAHCILKLSFAKPGIPLIAACAACLVGWRR